MNILFGDYIKQRRIEQRLSLRKFCNEIGVDPSNWSKIERGFLNAPTDKNTLLKICLKLGLKFNFVHDLAKISTGQLPEYSEEDFVRKLPIFFNKKPSKKDLEELIKLIKEDLKAKH